MKLKSIFNISPEYFIFKYMWLLVCYPNIYIVLAMCGMLLVKNNFKFYYNNTVFLLLIFNFIYIFSIFLNFNLNPSRFFNELASALGWLISIYFYSYYSHNKIDLNKLKKYFFINTAIILSISFVYVIFPELDFEIFNRTISHIQYDGLEKITRFRGFLEYATLNVTFIMGYFSLLFILPIGKYKKLLILLSLNIPVILTSARIGVIAMLIVNLVYISTLIPKKYKQGAYITVLPIIGLVLLKYFNEIISLLNSYYTLRDTSNEARFTIYQESIDKLMDNNFLLGIGLAIKSSEGPWLGSHSQYISFFYKAGLLGGIIVLLAFILIFKRIYMISNKKVIALGVILATLVFWIFETIDPDYTFLLLLFSTMGVLSNKKNMVIEGKEKNDE